MAKTIALDITTDVAGADAAAPTRIGRGRLTWRRFARNKGALVGMCVIGFLILVAVIGPHVLPWDFMHIDSPYFLKPPSARHWLGTTTAGRDVLAMVVHGIGRSLIIGSIAAVLMTGIACAMGATAAYFGKLPETVITWIIDMFLIVPAFLMEAVMMKGHSTPKNSWLILPLVLGVFGWMMTGRVVRSLTLSIKQREYVLAARYAGLSAPRIIIRHILPNISSLLIIDLTLNVGAAILAEAGLSFFGFGILAPDTSLGTLISEGAQMATTYPWIFSAPAIVLVILVMCVNAMGDGLRDALDPSSMSGGQA